jgi:hypothetical protein
LQQNKEDPSVLSILSHDGVSNAPSVDNPDESIQNHGIGSEEVLSESVIVLQYIHAQAHTKQQFEKKYNNIQ